MLNAFLMNRMQKSKIRFEASKEAQAEKDKTKLARTELASFKEQLEQNSDEEDRIARKIAKIQRRQKRKDEGEMNGRQKFAANQAAAAAALRSASKIETPSTIQQTGCGFAVGDYVKIKGQNSIGKIENITGSSAKVLFGMMYMHVSSETT